MLFSLISLKINSRPERWMHLDFQPFQLIYLLPFSRFCISFSNNIFSLEDINFGVKLLYLIAGIWMLALHPPQATRQILKINLENFMFRTKWLLVVVVLAPFIWRNQLLRLKSRCQSISVSPCLSLLTTVFFSTSIPPTIFLWLRLSVFLSLAISSLNANLFILIIADWWFWFEQYL